MRRALFMLSLMIVALALLATSAFAQLAPTVVAAFSAERGLPFGSLIQGSDGNLYGTTFTGGRWGQGSIFRMAPDGTGYTTLYSFASTNDGGFPRAELVEGSDGCLYGMTSSGGSTTAAGTIFRIALDGSFETLHVFGPYGDPAKGAGPAAGLIEVGGFFYGTTESGGLNGTGTIFRLDVSSHPAINVTVMHSFGPRGTTGLGAQPVSTLVELNGFLYGTTKFGGRLDHGTIFRLDPSTANVTLIHDFAGGGMHPHAGLTPVNGLLYGTTLQPCINSTILCGSVFRIDPLGQNFEEVHWFNEFDGFGAPRAPVVLGSDGALYGTAEGGGLHGDGVVFRIDITVDPPITTTIHDLDSLTTGTGPQAGVLQVGTSLVVTAPFGGPGGAGTIVRVPMAGGPPIFVHGFGPASPYQPTSTLVSDGTSLFGTSNRGGYHDSGTLFSLTGNTVSTLHAFHYETDGGYGVSSLIRGSDGSLYGTAANGGPLQGGTIFRFNPAIPDFDVLHRFDGMSSANGATPQSSVLELGGRLYGTTIAGGAHHAGVVYSVALDGTDFRVLHSFNYSLLNGAGSAAPLIRGSDGRLYGTTAQSGLYGFGTVYRLNTDGTGFQVVHAFDRFDPNSGSDPYAALVEAEPMVFLGTTVWGGSSREFMNTGGGTVFKLDMRTTPPTFTVLRSFDECCISAPAGSSPRVPLARGAGGWFYGTTSMGGSSGFNGTVFAIDDIGTFHVLHHFDQNNGTNPNALMVMPDGSFYGTTSAGGPNSSGVIFHLTIDTDGDGILQGIDNCPFTANADQADSNGDGIGNACPREPVVQLSASTLDFGPILYTSTSAPRRLTLTNAGTRTLTITSIGIAGGGFTLTSACPPSLGAAASCVIDVVFAPSAPGQQSGVLSIVNNAAGSPHQVTLNGVALGIPGVTVSPAALEFAYQPLGTISAPQTVTLTNIGNGDLTIASIASASAQFGVTPACPRVLLPSASCAISVDLRPTVAAALHTSVLAIAHDAQGSPHTVVLTGFGDRTELTVTPQALGFEARSLGSSSAAQIVTLLNTGTTPVALSGVSVSASETGHIETFAGVYTGGLTADGVPAIDARLGPGGPHAITFDRAGNLFLIEDEPPYRVRRIDALTGTIATVWTPAQDERRADAIAVDRSGNLFVAQPLVPFSHRILRVDSATGTTTTIGGNGGAFSTGDGGPATAAAIRVSDMTVDASGNVLIADRDHSVRRIDSVTGVITKVAGNPLNGTFVEGAPATSVSITPPLAIVLDAAGNLFIKSTMASGVVGVGESLVVYRVDAVSGIITTVHRNVMNAFSVIDGGLAIDHAGNLFAQDTQRGVVYRIEEFSLIVVAGGALGTPPGNGDGLPATDVRLAWPKSIAIDQGGNLYVVDGSLGVDGGVIRRVSAASLTGSEFAITNGCGNTLGIAQSCEVSVRFTPESGGLRLGALTIASDAAGAPHRVRLAGIGRRPVAYVRPTAINVGALAVGNTSSAQVISVANSGNAPLMVSSVELAGTNPAHFSIAGSTCGGVIEAGLSCRIHIRFSPPAAGPSAAVLRVNHSASANPLEVTLQGEGVVLTLSISPNPLAFGNVDIGTSSTQSLTVTNTGPGSIALGAASLGGSNAGDFSAASSCPADLAAAASCTISLTFTPTAVGPLAATLTLPNDAAGNPHSIDLEGTGVSTASLLVSPALVDFAFRPVGQASAPQTVTITNAGSGPAAVGAVQLEGRATSEGLIQSILPANPTALGEVVDVAIDGAGNLFVADASNHRVVRIDARTRQASVIAGTGAEGYSGDGGLATAARLHTPSSIAIGQMGSLYVADAGNHVVRRIDGAGTISTIAGTGIPSYSGDNGPAVNAELRVPRGIAFDRLGNLYIADSQNHAVRRVDTQGVITTVAGTGSPGTDAIVGSNSIGLNAPQDVLPNPFGELYIADTGNNRVLRVSRLGHVVSVSAHGIFNEPSGLAFDTLGRLFVADTFNHWIVRIEDPGHWNTTRIAGSVGNGGQGLGGFADDVPALQGAMMLPTSLVVDTAGNVIIADRGNHRIRVVHHATSNSSDEFTVTNHCPAALPAGQSCTLDIAFTPQLSSIRVATLTIHEGASAHRVDLTGVGTRGALVVDPPSLSILTEIGLLETRTIEVLNNGNGSLNLSAITASTPFTLTSSCAAILAPGGTCQVEVAFDATAIGSVSGQVALAHDGLPQPNVINVSAFAGSASTQVRMTSSPIDRATFGEPVTFTITVSSAYQVPTGVVRLFDGANILALALPLDATGTTTYTSSTFAAGPHALRAHYIGIDLHRDSSAMLTYLVDPQPTTAALTAIPLALTYGQRVTLTGLVSSRTNGPLTGSIEFLDGGTPAARAVIVNGVATATIPLMAAGSHSITASYEGDSNSLPSASPSETVDVAMASTTTTLTVSPSQVYRSHPATFTATVAPQFAGMPGGTVTFTNGQAVLAIVPVIDGRATLTHTFTTYQFLNIRARYSGDANFTTSLSPAIQQWVTLAPVTLTVTASANPAFAGDSVTFTVSTSTPIGPLPDGSVINFTMSGLGSIPLTVSGGTATYTTTLSASPPWRFVSAQFTATATYSYAFGFMSHETRKRPSTTTLSSSLNPSMYGQPVTFLAEVTSSVGPPPDGELVRFYMSGAFIGSAALVGGFARLTTSTLPVGTRQIRADYSGPTFANSSSGPPLLSQVVNVASSVTTVTSSRNPAPPGTSVDFTATVTSPGGAVPAGVVVFRRGTIFIGMRVLSNGTATLSVSNLAAGTHDISATFTSNTANMSGSVGTVVQRIQ